MTRILDKLTSGLLLGAVTIALLTGCSKPQKLEAKIAPKPPEWTWDIYPLIPKMRLATLGCQLQPRSMLTIPSPVAGTLRVYLDQPQTNLAKGTVWAEFEPEVFAAEAEALEEARLKLDQREKFQLELDIPRQKVQLTRQIESAQRQMDLMRFVSTNQELSRYMFYGTPGMESAMRPQALAQAELELGILKQTYDYVQQTNLAFMGIDLPALRSDLEHRKRDFDRRHGQARIQMPFAGQLTLTLPVTDGVQEYLVNAGQELAVARDLSAIRVRVPVANAAWTGIPGEQLEAIVRLPNGEELRAPYAFQKIERQQQREESVYYFSFPAEKSAMASRLLGTDVSCELWVKLPHVARIVPKMELLLKKSDAFPAGRPWPAGVAQAFPGAQVIAEGQTDIAILPADQKVAKAL